MELGDGYCVGKIILLETSVTEVAIDFRIINRASSGAIIM